MYCLPSIALLMIYLSGVIIGPPCATPSKLFWNIFAIAADSNIGKPSSNEAFPPPAVIAKKPEIVQSPFLYAANTLGITGAAAFPL